MLALAIPLLLTLAAPPSDGEKEFEAKLEQVDRMIATGGAKKAKELLLDTIEKSKDQPWALYHLTEVLDDLRRATFWSTNQKPDPKTLISGDLLAWSASSGQIKVRYRLDDKKSGASLKGPETGKPKKDVPRPLRDFDKSGTSLIHPIAFDGPYTIEIEGKNYPRLTEPPKTPGVVVCATWNRQTLVSFGLPGVSKYVPARILNVEDGEITEAAESDDREIPSGEYQLKVVVTSSTITLYSSGSEILTAKNPGSVYGRMFFTNLPDVSEIRITGKAQPSWLQGVVDAAIQERWTKFEESYKAVDELPAWLREKAYGKVAASAWTDESIPGKAEASDEKPVRGFFERFEEKGAEEALKLIRSTSGGSSRDELNSWLSALALRALGRDGEALVECEKVCAVDPAFFPARRMKVDLQTDEVGRAEALEECSRVLAEFPEEPKAYYDLAALQLMTGRPEIARDAIRKSIDDGVPAGTLEEAEHLVVRAIRGPLWSRVYEYKTRNYVVRSDIDQSICFDAATLLEKFHAKFNIHLRRDADAQKRTFPVFLFSGEEGYQAYSSDLFGRESRGTAGLYSPVVKQLLIWNLPDSEEMMRTVRHEGFHQYFDSLVGASPVWLNEGLAEYYEVSKLVKGAWSDGELHTQHLETLSEWEPWKLEEFLRVQPGMFYAPSLVELSYAQAWAFVHFLQNGGKEPKKRFDALIDALIAGTRPKDAVAKVFDAASLPKLEDEFRKYVERLR